MTILRMALPTPLRRHFDYLPPQAIDPKALSPGVRVRVPFQSRTLVGILIEVVQESSIPSGKLKQALEIIDQEPLLPNDVYKLCEWAADYYHDAFGEVLSAALPTLLRKGEPLSEELPNSPSKKADENLPVLNSYQDQAVSAILAAQNTFRAFLLYGVTGSGKTEVYLRSIAEVLKQDKQVLVLVPEISLTPQTIARFQSRFSVPVVALHSSMSDKKRLAAWCSARSGHAKIIIGTRSAIFTPCKALGLIIVDEEHDNSFKQQDRFRYHARDLALLRAKENHIPIVLGSATPSLESLLNVERKRYEYLNLPERAGNALMPTFELIDLRATSIEEGLSAPLLAAMRHELASNNQVMLFLNRRGFAPVLYCTQCAWTMNCKRCDSRMVYHNKPPRLQCHHCDARMNVPLNCQQCGEATLQPVGLGTQRIEEVLIKHFNDVPIIRVDRDSTRKKGEMEKLMQRIHAEPKAILLGTQMLAKGHHFPNVTLVGILDADSGLFSADFRATEQMGQLLMQVAGRAGRAEKAGKVWIQTRYPEHTLLQTLLHEGYTPFSENLLLEREQASLPPYSYLAVFRSEAYDEQKAEKFLTDIKTLSAGFPKDTLTVMGPVPALLSKKKGLYCHQLIVKAKLRSSIYQFVNYALQKIESTKKTTVKWTVDIDPVDIG